LHKSTSVRRFNRAVRLQRCEFGKDPDRLDVVRSDHMNLPATRTAQLPAGGPNRSTTRFVSGRITESKTLLARTQTAACSSRNVTARSFHSHRNRGNYLVGCWVNPADGTIALIQAPNPAFPCGEKARRGANWNCCHHGFTCRGQYVGRIHCRVPPC